MKSKEDKIREAWNGFKDIIPSAIERALNSNGCVHRIDLPDNCKLELVPRRELSNYYRPKELSGIEDNNGWLHLTQEVVNTLPDGKYHLYFKEGIMDHPVKLDWIHFLFDCKEQELPTHYKPYVEQKPPIY